jgi:ketosteroid isomerase-like protein
MFDDLKREHCMSRWVMGIAAAGLLMASSLTIAAAPSVTAEQQQVLHADRAWADAEIRRDSAALRRMLDDQFIAVYGSGKVVNKEQFIKDVIGGADDSVTSQDLTDVAVIVARDTAVVTELDTARGAHNGHPYTQSFRLTTTYIKRKGKWLALAERFGPAADPTAEEAAIKKADEEWAKTAQSRNVDGWLAFYADDAVIMPPNDIAAYGKEGARKPVSELLALPGLVITWEATNVEVARSGDIGYLTGEYLVAFKNDHGQTATDRGKLLQVWRKQPDGSWKCIADTWNSDQPASAPTTK